MAARKRNESAAAPAARKPRVSAADKAALAAAALADKAAAEHAAAKEAELQAMVAERRVAAETALVEVDGWVATILAAVKVDDGDAARAGVEQLIGAARNVARVYGRRKAGGPVGARSPKNAVECRYQAVHPDGTVLAGSNYIASTRRDVAMAKKRMKDGVAREGDARLAEAAVVDTQAAEVGA